jgi:hypothetical protein
MDGLTDLVMKLEVSGQFAKHLAGVVHLLIGRRISHQDGSVISTGLTWRELAALLANQKLDIELVRQLGIEPEELSPRERPRFWYSAIAIARPDGPAARADAEPVIAVLKPMGYIVGPAPMASITLSTSLPPNLKKKKPEDEGEAPKKRKR